MNTRRVVVASGAAIVAVALAVSRAGSATPESTPGSSRGFCVAQDRMHLFGCVPGQAESDRARGSWRIDPGMVAWNGPADSIPLGRR